MHELLAWLVSAAALFLRAVQWMVFAHVVISWLPLLGIRLYLRHLEVAARTLYAWVRRLVPTQLGPVDFAPVVVMFACQLAAAFLSSLSF